MIKPYSVFIIGPNGPTSDELVRTFWLKKNAFNTKASMEEANSYLPNVVVGVYDNLKGKWL